MNAKLICNGTQLDLVEGLPFPLNYSISDVKEPQKRKRNLSKSITLVGTNNNLNFFSSTYQLSLTDLNGDSTGFNFDPTKRVEAKYYKGDILVFDGLLQLNEVEINDGNYYFSCTMFSNFVDLFLQLGERTVAELGWSEYDHALTRTIVKNSWDTSVMVNGVATSNFTAGVPQGFGYVYPLVDYGYNTIPTTFGINNLVPLIYCKEIVEKCFAVAGLTFDSNHINSDLFKKLVFGFEGGKRRVLTTAQINARHLEAEGDFMLNSNLAFSQNYPFNNRIYTQDSVIGFLTGRTSGGLTTTTIDDPSGIIAQSSPGLLQYVNLAGTYKMTVTGSFQQTLTLAGDQTYVGGNHGFVIEFLKYGSVIDTFTVMSNNGDLVVGANYTKTFEYSTNNNNSIFTSIRVRRVVNLVINGVTQTIDFTDETPIPFAYEITCLDGTLNDGSTVTLSPVIPDMKAKDFMEDMIKAFNWYISDPDIFNVSKIEPLNDFYQATTEFDDWSQLIDKSKSIKILPASTIDGKVYQFSFQQEDDYDNKRYQDEFNQRYGDFDYIVESTYQNTTRKYELRFGQAVPIELVNSDIVLPRIVKLENNAYIPYRGKPKIYFYNGLKTGDFRLTNVLPAGGSEDLISYPCVHHFDDFENPTFDFNWGLPKRIYYGNMDTIVTTNNLYYAHHDKFIRELTGKDSKILQCYVKFSSQMVNTLDYSKLKMWNGVLYRLNEIKDFDSDVAESTFVELVRIIEAENPINLQGLGEATGEQTVGLMSGGTDVDEDTNVVFGGIGVSRNSEILTGG
jgi:hypothetical protein